MTTVPLSRSLRIFVLCYMCIVAHSGRVEVNQDENEVDTAKGFPGRIQKLVDKVSAVVTSVDGVFERLMTAKSGELDLARFQRLLADGANPNLLMGNNRSALTTLLDMSKIHKRSKGSLLLEALRVLLGHGADPNMQDAKGRIPLRICSSSMVREGLALVGAGADLNLISEYNLREFWLPELCSSGLRHRRSGDFQHIEDIIGLFIERGWKLEPQNKNLNYILFWAVHEKSWHVALQMVLWGANQFAIFRGQTARAKLLAVRKTGAYNAADSAIFMQLSKWTGPFGQRKIKDGIKQEETDKRLRSWLGQGELWWIRHELTQDPSLKCPMDVRNEVFQRLSCRTRRNSELWEAVDFFGISPTKLQTLKCKRHGPWDWDALIAETTAEKNAEEIRKAEAEARRKAELQRIAQDRAKMLEFQAQQEAEQEIQQVAQQDKDTTTTSGHESQEPENGQGGTTEAAGVDPSVATALSRAVAGKDYPTVEKLLCTHEKLVPKIKEETSLGVAYDEAHEAGEQEDPALKCALMILETADGNPMPPGCCKTASRESASGSPSSKAPKQTIAQQCAKVHRATPREGWHPFSSDKCKCYGRWELSTECGWLSGRRKFDPSDSVFDDRECQCVHEEQNEEYQEDDSSQAERHGQEADEELIEEMSDKLHDNVLEKFWPGVEAILCGPWITPSPCDPDKCPSLNPTSYDEDRVRIAWEDGERDVSLKCAIQILETPPGRSPKRNGCCGSRIRELIFSE